MSIEIHTTDEHAQWPATIVYNGSKLDYSTGYTFTCAVVNQSTGATMLSKTTGVTGAANGLITVAFTGAELATASVTATFAATPQTYLLYLTPRKVSDSSDGPTVEETLVMRWRP